MKKLIIFLLTTLTLTSCLNDFLDVKPVSEVTSASFWKTENDVRGALNSVYAFMQQNISSNNGYNYMAWYEGRSDNFVGSTTGTAYPMSVVNMNKLSSVLPATDWNTWYKEISAINAALYFVPNMSALGSITRDNYLAEAHFLRAYCYFNLIRIWGDVPMVVSPVISVDQITSPTQMSKKVIMDSLILTDLKQAVALVDTTKKDEIFRFSPGALYALGTDVAMWNHDYSAAIDYSTKLNKLNKYKLVDGIDFYKVCATGITSENIWTLDWSYANNGYNKLVYALQNNSVTYLQLSVLVLNQWGTGKVGSWKTDVRRNQSIDTTLLSYIPTDTRNISKYGAIWKWTPGNHSGINTTNQSFLPLYRLADIVLLRAEAYNKLGDLANALKELNSVRAKRGLPDRLLTQYDTAPDKVYAIESDILQERQFELLGEGRRWFDLIRTGRAMSVLNNHFQNYLLVSGYTKDDYNVFTDEWQLYWPVSQDNIVGNLNLKQIGNY